MKNTECARCGVVVASAPTHDAWHAELEDAELTEAAVQAVLQARISRRVEAPMWASGDRKVWTATIPDGDEYGVGPVEVMVEQFGDRPPTVAFRRDRQQTWARPYRTEVAP